MIKAYTNYQQSCKLVEILSRKSANMYYDVNRDGIRGIPDVAVGEIWDKDVPCWSLAALLEQIPSDLGSASLTIEKDDSERLKYGLNYHDRWEREDDIRTKYYDNLVDACYEMIIKLHEKKLI